MHFRKEDPTITIAFVFPSAEAAGSESMQKELVNYLLAAGAEVSRQDNLGKYPFNYARHTEIRKLLATKDEL